MKTSRSALTCYVSPIDVVLPADYWISHFQPWWKNRWEKCPGCVNHHRMFWLWSWELLWASAGVTRPKTHWPAFHPHCSFSLNLLLFSVLIQRKSIPSAINIDLFRAQAVTGLFRQRCVCQRGAHNQTVRSIKTNKNKKKKSDCFTHTCIFQLY